MKVGQCVKGKFFVNTKTEYQNHGNEENANWELSLEAVTTGSEENLMFGKYTPSGNLTIRVPRRIAEMFSPGEEFYLDFSPVQKEV